MAKPCILYGGPFSLYTGKARAYLIKQKIPYQELTPTTERYYIKASKLEASRRVSEALISIRDT